MYEAIVSAFCETYNKISQNKMNRVLGDLNEFEFFNAGMLNRYNSGESYRISSGFDVSEAIDPSTGRMYSTGHAFCKANTTSQSLTIGYSSGSKIWSSSYFSVPEYISWCNENGSKIGNDEIIVKTNTNFDLLPIAKELEEYPDNLFMVDFNPETYNIPPVIFMDKEQGTKFTLLDSLIKIVNINKSVVKLSIKFDDYEEIFECDTQGRYQTIKSNLMLKCGRYKLNVSEYLNTYPLLFRTTDDATISGNNRFEGNPDALIYDNSTIEAIDWENYGTDVTLEFGNSKKNSGISIQAVLKKILESDPQNKYIIYDHSNGEIADYITIREEEYSFHISLFHVKKMTGKKYNSSVDDIYEVAGQAVKSVIWFKKRAILLDKMSDRQKSGNCKFIKGSLEEFRKEFTVTGKQYNGSVIIVQPAISKNIEMPEKIQQVIAAATYYIKNSGKVKELRIFGSK